VLDDLLRHHDGVITLAQARLAGLSQDAVDRRVRSGHWRRCANGVYFAEDHAFSDAARVRSIVWSYGAEAAASGLAAAWWHGIVKSAPDLVEVTIPRESRRRQLPGSKSRRRNLKPADIVEQNGLRVTALELTAVEAAVRPRGGPKIMDTALQRHTELPKLWTAHLRNKGRHGSPRSRMLLQGAADGTRSHAERLFVQLLRSHGITGWKANYPIGGYVVDFVFADAKVAIEIDGLAHHSGPDEFQNDRVRQNRITLLGWTVLRFTWIDLVEQPERVIAELQRAICGV
jgi:very-short-patch-repair endonuclease